MQTTETASYAHHEPTSSPSSPSDSSDSPLASDIRPLTSAVSSRRRRTGKVAQLPSQLRHQINTLLEDGASYPAIIQALGAAGAHLTQDNLSQWKHGGYQDWIQDQESRYLFDQTLNHAAELGQDLSPNQLLMHLLRVTAVNLMTQLRRLDFTSEPGHIDPARLRLISLVPRLTQLMLEVRKSDTALAEQTSPAHAALPGASRAVDRPKEPSTIPAPIPVTPTPPVSSSPSLLDLSAALPSSNLIPFPSSKAPVPSPAAAALVAEALVQVAASTPGRLRAGAPNHLGSFGKPNPKNPLSLTTSDLI